MQERSIVSAICFDGQGRGVPVAEADLSTWTSERGTLWVHLDYSKQATAELLASVLKLDPVVVDALAEEETQPRYFVSGDNLFLVLRGLNQNPDADILDMVAIRVWIEPHRIITSRKRWVAAVHEVQTKLEEGVGPTGVDTFLVQLCDQLSERMDHALTLLEDEEDSFEALALEDETYKLRSAISNLRRRIITMRRFLAPQRQVLSQLQSLNLPWLDTRSKAGLREIADRTARNVDDLDAVRDRAAVAQDELESRHSEQINKTMYLLSIVAAVFLPLSLLTGLLGVNVLGIPGADNPYGFYVVCALLVVIAGFEIWLFRFKGWL